MLHAINPGASGGEQGGCARPSSLLSSDPQAGRGWGRASLGCPLPTQQHLTAKPSSFSRCPFPTIPFVLPQGRTEELEESGGQCPLPTFPSKVSTVLGASLCLMQGGHRRRRTDTVLDVLRAWSKFTLLAHRALAREFFPGFLSL